MKLAVAVVLLLGPARAWAGDLLCGPVEKGQIRVDGLTDDWVDVQGADAGGASPDLAFSFKCNTEGKQLDLLVDVHDNYFVRTAKNRPGEDHVTLTLGGKRLLVYPGNARDIPTRVTWGTSPAKNVKASSALQEYGYAIELIVPFAALPSYKPGMPLPYSVSVADCDSKAQLKTEKSLVASGNIVFAEADAALDAFLGDRKLKRSDIWIDRGLALGGKSGARLVIAGRTMAVISDEYVYLELPAQSRADVKDVKVIDLAGDGREAVVVRYVERGGGGTRELLTVYRPGGAEIRRGFSAELARTNGSVHVEDKVSFVKRGRATDIVIEPGSASGVTQASWREPAAEDAVPIMLPWETDKRARYQFSGDEYKRAQ
jgi:hypothetical protein